MSAKIKTLKDVDGTITYPQTVTTAVYDPTSGKMLHELLRSGIGGGGGGGGSAIGESFYSYTTESAIVVSFSIPDFDASTMALDVYVNGLHCMPSRDYTRSGAIVTLVNELDAGQTVDFVVRRVIA